MECRFAVRQTWIGIRALQIASFGASGDRQNLSGSWFLYLQDKSSTTEQMTGKKLHELSQNQCKSGLSGLVLVLSIVLCCPLEDMNTIMHVESQRNRTSGNCPRSLEKKNEKEICPGFQTFFHRQMQVSKLRIMMLEQATREVLRKRWDTQLATILCSFKELLSEKRKKNNKTTKDKTTRFQKFISCLSSRKRALHGTHLIKTGEGSQWSVIISLNVIDSKFFKKKSVSF